jgi:hypothetical protein
VLFGAIGYRTVMEMLAGAGCVTITELACNASFVCPVCIATSREKEEMLPNIQSARSVAADLP